MSLSRRRAAVGLAFGLAAVVVQPLGCRVIAGVDDRAETCGGGLAQGACGVCQSERCCTYASRCNDRADCTRFRDCIGGCRASDELCRGRCANTHPEGASAVAALDDCAQRQCADSCGSWSCLGKVVWPEPPASVTVTVKLMDGVDQHLLRGLNVAACQFGDTECAGSEVKQTDANGAATLTMTRPHDGFVRVWGHEATEDGGADAGGADAGSDDEYRALIFYSPPLNENGTVAATGIISIRQILTLGSALPNKVDLTTRGGVLVEARDCDRLRTNAVAVDVMPRDPAVAVLYIDGVLPNPTLEETTTGGLAAITNVPPGPVTVTARSSVAQRQIGARQVFVRAGYITYLVMPPMPEKYP